MQNDYLSNIFWKKLHYNRFWYDRSEYQLIWSLEEDGRFYGAEWQDGDYEPEDLLIDRLLYP